METLIPIFPETLFVGFTLVYFLVGLWIKERKIHTLLVVVFSVLTMFSLSIFQGETFKGMFVADPFSQTLKLVFLINLGLCSLMGMHYPKIKDEVFYEFNLLLMLSTLGMMFMVSSRELLSLFLSLEFMSLCLYLLAGLVVTDLKSNEASLKYYLLGSMFSALFVLGISIFFGVFGGTHFLTISEKVSLFADRTFYLLAGVVLVLSALSFKAGLAPFHQWSPDVYEGAPTPVTAFMSVGPKAAAVGAMARFLIESLSLAPNLWIGPLIFIAFLTVGIGNILALRQNNLKRLLAYSSIAHAGYLLLAVIACSTTGLKAIAFYALVYAFMNLGAFATLIAFPQGERINSFQGLSQVSLFLAFAMLVFLFSLTGLPPFGGFVAKFFVFKSIIEAGYTWVAVVVILFSILSAYYYLRVGVKMFFYEGGLVTLSVPFTLRLVLTFTLIFTTLLGVFPVLFAS